MNLMKLLTVGQSLEEGKNVSGKYKLNQQSLLPKFAGKAPSGAPARTSENDDLNFDPAVPVSETPTPPPSPCSASVPPPSVPGQTQKIAAGTILKREEEPAVLFPRMSFMTRIKISSAKIKFFQSRPRKNYFTPPIQAEWALEKIKVARNDLNDSDLEVVSAKLPTMPTRQKTALADLPRIKNSVGGWINMTSRLFKTNSPFKKRAAQNSSASPSEVRNRSPFAGRT